MRWANGLYAACVCVCVMTAD